MNKDNHQQQGETVEAEKAVEQFVETLFTNGAGQKAARLVLWSDSREASLGGWCRSAIIGRVNDFLAATLPVVRDAEVEEAVENAFTQAVVRCARMEAEGSGPMTVTREMFNAGLAAAKTEDLWVAIARDGLPTEDGPYLWRRDDGYYEAIGWVQEFDGEAHSWANSFTHYQKITPPSGEKL